MIYFAYGSNMLHQRLAERVGEATLVGPAHLDGHVLEFNKLGADGSGKCTLSPSRAGTWGVAFRISPGQKFRLDAYEGGYSTSMIMLSCANVRFEAFTYIAAPGNTHRDVQPFDWYREIVVAGARRAPLPGDYIDAICAIDTIRDPDRARARSNLNALCK